MAATKERTGYSKHVQTQYDVGIKVRVSNDYSHGNMNEFASEMRDSLLSVMSDWEENVVSFELVVTEVSA
jgi:hypothetical protein